MKQARGVAGKQCSHAPAKVKAAEAQAAAREPASAIEAKAQARQVDQMEQAPVPPFNAAAFKAALMKRIEETAPKNLEQADELRKENKLGAVKDEMAGKVKAEKEASQKPLAEKTREAPSKAGIEAKSVTNLPPVDTGKAPAGIGAERAVPKSRPPIKVELPMRQESQSLDQQMAESQVTDQQLEKSNEPDFQGALKSKQEAQAHAAKDPEAFRQFEGKQLTKAEAEAVAVAQQQVQSIYGDRGKALNQMAGQQSRTQGRDEQARAKVAGDIQNIYLAAKAKVEAILDGLDAKVERAFDAGSAAAKEMFEDYVGQRMDAYKEKRYSGLAGKARWVKDLFADLPPEVNRFYEEGRSIYLLEMDRTIDRVITIIGAELTRAKAEIQKGKDDIGKYVARLPLELADVGRQAAGEMQEKFTQLEESVNSKQETLIDTLAQKYQQNLQAVDERIKEMQEANKGLISKAAGFVKGVIETIKKLGQLLRTVLNRIADVVGLILQDPIGFFKNLIAGLTLGFNNFVANIEKHLIAGLLTWLTGTLGPMNIKMPEDIFSLKGIFSLIMQVLGLTWEYMRAKAVGLFGETVVAGMEKMAAIFQRLKEGPAAVWEYVKEEFNDLKESVLEQIKEMVSTEVIKAGVKWLLSLLNPVAAFIKAAMAIYNIITFIVDRARQIADFILSLVDAIAAIAKGAIDSAAAKVESALAKSIPLIIGLLASLLGITGLVTKVQKIIQRVRKRIDGAITKLLIKAKSMVVKTVAQARQLGRLVVSTVRSAAGAIVGWLGLRKTFRAADGQTHSVYFSGDAQNATVMMATRPDSVQRHIDARRTSSPAPTAVQEQSLRAAERTLLEIRRLTRPGGRTPPETETLRQDIDLLLTRLTTELRDGGVAVGVPLSNVTYLTDPRNRTEVVRATPLSARAGNTTGSRTSASDPPGWASVSGRLIDNPETYVRMHLLSHLLHGPGIAWNLVPAPQTVNVGWMLSNVEGPLKTATAAGAVFNYSATVEYPDTGGPIDNFPSEITVTWSAIISPPGVTIPTPPGANERITPPTFSGAGTVAPPELNGLSFADLQERTDLPQPFCRAIANARTRGTFTSPTNFKQRVHDALQRLFTPPRTYSQYEERVVALRTQFMLNGIQLSESDLRWEP